MQTLGPMRDICVVHTHMRCTQAPHGLGGVAHARSTQGALTWHMKKQSTALITWPLSLSSMQDCDGTGGGVGLGWHGDDMSP